MDVSVFELDEKRITVFPGVSSSPVVYLNCFEDPSEDIDRQIALPHSLVCMSRMNWSDDLSPWRADGLSRRDPPFAGGADAYLAWLGSAVIPAVEKGLQKPGNRIIAGYSLAGLFALYAVYQCDLFTRCVSASGSLWYPGFVDFCRAHPCSTSLTDVYLSLGDREHLTRHPVLASVRSCTEEIYQLLDARGIRCMLEWNPGSHFVDEQQRLCRGIRRCLGEKE